MADYTRSSSYFCSSSYLCFSFCFPWSWNIDMGFSPSSSSVCCRLGEPPRSARAYGKACVCLSGILVILSSNSSKSSMRERQSVLRSVSYISGSMHSTHSKSFYWEMDGLYLRGFLVNLSKMMSCTWAQILLRELRLPKRFRILASIYSTLRSKF